VPKAFPYRISFVGCPAQSDVPWTREYLQWLVDHAFNTVQLSIAWGCRPSDEPLNLEDVVDCTAMALFPWDASWWIREIGKSNPQHGMDAAFIRGQQAHTPSWESSRRAIFMFTDDRQPDPWALEDIQLRCHLSADELQRAIDISKPLPSKLAASLAGPLTKQIEELIAWRQRALSYAFHLRETNLCSILRRQIERGQNPPTHTIDELRDVLNEDMRNQANDEPCRSALELLDRDLNAFLKTYFQIRGEDRKSRGEFTTTTK